jgi:UPF0755 protein
MKKLLLSLFSIGMLIAASGALWVMFSLSAPGPLPEQKTVYIEPGISGRAIAERLLYEGALDTNGAYLFRLGAKIHSSGGSLKAGEYLIPARASIRDLISLLQSGKTYQRFITLPEGLMAFELVDIINNAEAMNGTIESIPAEGSLLPETYSYSYGEDRLKIITRAQQAMTTALNTLWETHDETLPLKTPQEAVILASIVEKETGVASERKKVAGVFINRLKTGMPLQSDPTTIYALTLGKKRLERELLRKDLNMESPYNTYAVNGLPPTPIANPGRAALEAVFDPEEHGYFYFVADGTGGHAFAATLEEHTRNVGNWRNIQKKLK